MRKKTGKRRYLELNLHNAKTYPAKLGSPKIGHELETLRIIKKAGDDKNINGLLLNSSGFSANKVCLWELRSSLETFKARGKKIVAYFDNADFDLYCMLSVADRVVMDEGGILAFAGHAWGRLYAKEALAKLGIGFRELRYLDFKSANEMFSRTSLSEADKKQYGAYLDEVFNLTRTAIMQARSLSEENFNALVNGDFLLSPQAAKEKGLADTVGREEAIEGIIRELEADAKDPPDDLEIDYAVSGSASLMTHDRHASHYAPPKPGRFGKPAEIAVIYAKGNTDLDQGMAARSLSRTIFEAAEKSAVKALVVRIDSPGGSAVAADYVAQAIKEAKKQKPVVVSMGQVAASGGYWAAMYASHIMASACTLTGSIGVIAGWFYDKGLNDKLGLDLDTLSRGAHADLFTGVLIPRRDLTDAEEANYRRYILELYGDFVKKAALGRNITPEVLEPLARGRVYSGLAAQKLGLVDSIGGFIEAIETARKLAGIPEKKKTAIREYPRPKLREALMQRFFAGVVPGIDIGVLEDLRFRLSRNGEAMPILPWN
ncbi:signal peptide peptidase SppA [Leadbettera azotonutricia]|uniref:Peptidase S49, protease IV n=1 Tax=Leadbettera azotonutricia (strain ATCC BAA-888 / DSM 13862 / ZAS-9) TaxID=545695 RepID=F5YF44_LEAAZ|nr:signal peptide peptidase SppA [Leadbettera azotonutricia]AEF82845.1 peptidase S49, protease IV [Leadbettera azotonutricia ZAS-9]